MHLHGIVTTNHHGKLNSSPRVGRRSSNKRKTATKVSRHTTNRPPRDKKARKKDAEGAAGRREKLREAGFIPAQFWVPANLKQELADFVEKLSQRSANDSCPLGQKDSAGGHVAEDCPPVRSDMSRTDVPQDPPSRPASPQPATAAPRNENDNQLEFDYQA